MAGIVLAAEAAIGKHPIDCVSVVKYMYKLHQANSRALLGSINIEIGSKCSNALKKWL